MKHKYYYQTPIGELCIEDNGYAITAIRLEKESNTMTEQSVLAKEAYKQLMEYFEKKRTTFNIPIYLEGTEFQKKVWNELRKIPYGTTLTYKDIARKIGNEKASRAVGGANNKNPILIVVPCHRVVGANGKLVGFACGIEVKEYLLQLEKDVPSTFIKDME